MKTVRETVARYWHSDGFQSFRANIRKKHDANLFSALKLLVPLGVVWLLVTNIGGMLTSVATPALHYMDASGLPRYVSLLLYCVIVYCTVLVLGALSRTGVRHAILFIEERVVGRIPLIRTVWSASRKFVLSLQEWLETNRAQGNGFLYVGAFRWGEVILVLPITDIGRRSCTLFNPSVPAPTNSEVVNVANENVVILRNIDPTKLITMICSTGFGLATLVDTFLALEKEGGHTVADYIARGEITTGRDSAASPEKEG